MGHKEFRLEKKLDSKITHKPEAFLNIKFDLR